jgi:hypothetical protein
MGFALAALILTPFWDHGTNQVCFSVATRVEANRCDHHAGNADFVGCRGFATAAARRNCGNNMLAQIKGIGSGHLDAGLLSSISNQNCPDLGFPNRFRPIQ